MKKKRYVLNSQKNLTFVYVSKTNNFTDYDRGKEGKIY